MNTYLTNMMSFDLVRQRRVDLEQAARRHRFLRRRVASPVAASCEARTGDEPVGCVSRVA